MFIKSYTQKYKYFCCVYIKKNRENLTRKPPNERTLNDRTFELGFVTPNL